MPADACRFSPNTDWCVTPAVWLLSNCNSLWTKFFLIDSDRISTKTRPRPIRASHSSAAFPGQGARRCCSRGPTTWGWPGLENQQETLRHLGGKNFEQEVGKDVHCVRHQEWFRKGLWSSLGWRGTINIHCWKRLGKKRWIYPMEIETAGKLPLFSSIIFLLEQKNDRGVSIVMFEYHRRWSYCIDWVLKAHVLVRLCICSCMRFQFFWFVLVGGVYQWSGWCFCVTFQNLQSPCHRQKYHLVCYDNGQVVPRDSETLNDEGLPWACLKMGINIQFICRCVYIYIYNCMFNVTM